MGNFFSNFLERETVDDVERVDDQEAGEESVEDALELLAPGQDDHGDDVPEDAEDSEEELGHVVQGESHHVHDLNLFVVCAVGAGAAVAVVGEVGLRGRKVAPRDGGRDREGVVLIIPGTTGEK